MANARGQVTITVVMDGQDGAPGDAIQPNLFGYNTYISVGGIHTKTGCAILCTAQELSTTLHYCGKQIYFRDGDNNTKFPKGVYSISGKVRVIPVSDIPAGKTYAFQVNSDYASVIEGNSFISKLNYNEDNEFKIKVAVREGNDATTPYIFWRGETSADLSVGATAIVVLKDFKIERTENINGICTPFSGLAQDDIPQGQNLLTDTSDFGASWRSDTNKTFYDTYQGNKVLYYSGGTFRAASGGYCNFALQNVSLRSGATYTLSWWQWGKGKITVVAQNVAVNGRMEMFVRDCDNPEYDSSTLAATTHECSTQWEFHSMTFKATNPQSPFVRWCALGDTNVSGNNFYIAMPKLEEGDKPTAWQKNETDRKGEKGDSGERGSDGKDGNDGTNGADAQFRSLVDNGSRALFGIESEGDNKGLPRCKVNVDVTLYDIKGDEKTPLTLTSRPTVKLLDEEGNVLKTANISNGSYGIFYKGDLTAEKFATVAAAVIKVQYSPDGEEEEEIMPFALSDGEVEEETPSGGEADEDPETGTDGSIETYTLIVPVTFSNGVTFDINQKTNELNAWAMSETGEHSHFGMSPKQIVLRVGKAGIDLVNDKIILSAENTVINGDLNLKGVIIESTNEVDGNSLWPSPLIVDMNTTKSVTINNPLNTLVVLPMYEAFSGRMQDGDTFATPAFQQAGVHLTIYTSPVPELEGWSALDESLWQSNWHEVQNLLQYSTLVCADPRMLFWNGSFGLMKPMHQWSGMAYNWRDYADGRFSVRGAIGRFILLPPGQMLHLISSIQAVEDQYGQDKSALVWNVVNAADFEPAPFTLSATYYNSSSHYHKFPNGTPNMSMQWTGSADDWEDMFFAARQYKRACGVALGSVSGSPISGMSIGIKLAGPSGNEGPCMPYRTHPSFPNGVQMVSLSDV